MLTSVGVAVDAAMLAADFSCCDAAPCVVHNAYLIGVRAMAKMSGLNMALRGAAVAGLLFVSVAPSEAAWGERFSSLRGNSTATLSDQFHGWKWSLVQYRAQKYDQILSRIFQRPVSPFCRFFGC